jgi:hypothetical protein
MSTTYHPQSDDNGRPVLLRQPSMPTPLSAWENPDAVASVIPCGRMPPQLNGIPFATWADVPRSSAAWNTVSGQAPV